MTNKPVFFNHRAGDGVHYITDIARTLPDGTIEPGETSDVCILLHLQQVCLTYGLPFINDIWNELYPEDLMSDEDMGCIVASAFRFTEDTELHSTEELAAILDDAREMGCPELADRVKELLKEKGVVL